MHIASMNMGDLKTIKTYQTLIKRLQLQNIDIACVQETHNLETYTYEYLDYTIQFSPSVKDNNNDNINTTNKGTGGLAIAYRAQISSQITQIVRTNHRMREIHLNTNIKGVEIKIINTYAPHRGYSIGKKGRISDGNKKYT